MSAAGAEDAQGAEVREAGGPLGSTLHRSVVGDRYPASDSGNRRSNRNHRTRRAKNCVLDRKGGQAGAVHPRVAGGKSGRRRVNPSDCISGAIDVAGTTFYLSTRRPNSASIVYLRTRAEIGTRRQRAGFGGGLVRGLICTGDGHIGSRRVFESRMRSAIPAHLELCGAAMGKLSRSEAAWNNGIVDGRHALRAAVRGEL
jgi:hypothetical protein